MSVFVCTCLSRHMKERESVYLFACDGVGGAVGILNICLTDWDTQSHDLLKRQYTHRHTNVYTHTHKHTLLFVCMFGEKEKSGNVYSPCKISKHTHTNTHRVDSVQTSGRAGCSNGNRTMGICISHPHTLSHARTDTHTQPPFNHYCS